MYLSRLPIRFLVFVLPLAMGCFADSRAVWVPVPVESENSLTADLFDARVNRQTFEGRQYWLLRESATETSLLTDAMHLLREQIRLSTQNIENADSYLPDRQPYRRQFVTWDAATGKAVVRTDASEFPKRYDPIHPYADCHGFRLLSNVDVVLEELIILQCLREREQILTAISQPGAWQPSLPD